MNEYKMLDELISALASTQTKLTEFFVQLDSAKLEKTEYSNILNYSDETLLKMLFVEYFSGYEEDDDLELSYYDDSENIIKEKDFYKYQTGLMQELHNRISKRLGVIPCKIECCDFLDNEEMDMALCDSLYHFDYDKNTAFINFEQLEDAPYQGYTKLHTLLTVSYINRINQGLKDCVKGVNPYNMKDFEYFLMMFQAMHIFNIADQMENAYEIESKYLKDVGKMSPVENIAYLMASFFSEKLLMQNNLLDDKLDKLLKLDIKRYSEYLQENLIVISMKVANNELCAMINSESIEYLGKTFKSGIVYLFNRLAKMHFNKFGANIKKSFFEYLKNINYRFLLKNQQLASYYAERSLIERLIENKHLLLSQQELEELEEKENNRTISNFDDIQFEEMGEYRPFENEYSLHINEETEDGYEEDEFNEDLEDNADEEATELESLYDYTEEEAFANSEKNRLAPGEDFRVYVEKHLKAGSFLKNLSRLDIFYKDLNIKNNGTLDSMGEYDKSIEDAINF